MTGAETAETSMDRNDDQPDGSHVSDPAPVDSPFRKMIEARIKVWRSLRAPTVQQIEWCQFWEEYLKKPDAEKLKG